MTTATTSVRIECFDDLSHTLSQADPCTLCRSTRTSVIARNVRDYEYGTPGSYNWERCDGCGLVRLDPMPSDETLAMAYPQDYHAYHAHRSRLVRWYVHQRHKARAKELARLMPPGGTILDVGCGTGVLLSLVGAQGRFRLLGVEYRPDAAQIAGERAATVYTGRLEDVELDPESVDLVVMEHVLEHVRDPFATVRHILALLRPGGLLVGEVPNRSCLDAKIFGRYWGGGHVPRHLWMFTPLVLERLLRQSGFNEVTVSHPFYPAHIALSVQNWLRRSRTNTDGLTYGRSRYYPLLCSAALPLAMCASWLRRSGAMRFAARCADER